MDGKLIFIILLFSGVCSAQSGWTITLGDSDIKAFPGCEGFGADATGARGSGDVYFITNLNDTGAGSARQAFLDADTNGDGWVIPRVAGTVDFDARLDIGATNGDDSNIHYVGQAAPFQGIQFRASATTGTRKEIRVTGSNQVIRHFKSSDAGQGTHKADGIKLGWNAGEFPMENIVFDHLSIRGAESRTISFSTKQSGYTPVGTYLRKITISNCIFADPIAPSPMHIIHYGENQTQMSFLKNLLTNGKERHSLNNGTENQEEWMNNYNYNYWNGFVGRPRQKIDAMGNVYDVGAANDTQGPTFKAGNCSENDCPPSGDSDHVGSEYYYTDNLDNDTADGLADYGANWITYAVGARILGGTYTPTPAATLWADIKDDIGAGAGTDQGLDTFDALKITEVNTTTGSRPGSTRITVPDLTTGGAGAAYADSDSDGLSDQYELDQGGTTTSITNNARPATFTISDGTDVDQSGVTSFATTGYTHLDVFFADLAGDWDDFSRTEDTPTEAPFARIKATSTGIKGVNGRVKVSIGT